MSQKLERILDVAEALNWVYISDSSKWDEPPNDYHTASKGNLEF